MASIRWTYVLLTFLWCTLCSAFLISRKLAKLTSLRSTSPPGHVGNHCLQQFLDCLHQHSTESKLVALRIDRPRVVSNLLLPEHWRNLKEVQARCVELRSGLHVQLQYKYDTRDEFKNVKTDSISAIIGDIIQSGLFKRAVLETDHGRRLQLSTTQPPGCDPRELEYGLKVWNNPTTCAKASNKTLTEVNSRPLSAQHDRQKQTVVSVNEPFLHALGVTTTEVVRSSGGKRNSAKTLQSSEGDALQQQKFRPKVGMADKFRQIEKFVEIVDSLVQHQFGAGHRRDMGRNGVVIGTSIGELPSEANTTLGGRSLRVVDMGSGLGYLTFAVHAHLRRKFGPAGVGLRTLGVEQRPALVRRTSQVARELGEEFAGLSFVQASLAEYIAGSPEHVAEGVTSCSDLRRESQVVASSPAVFNLHGLLEMAGQVGKKKEHPAQSLCASLNATKVAPVDVLIALHACDTATDEAIWYGIQAGAEVIVVAPCCQKEVRRQMENNARGVQVQPSAVTDADGQTRSQSNPLRECLEYGIYREHVAEMVTDTLRALCLQYAGYDVKVFEFVSGEHTAKNILITATRKSAGVTEKRRMELRGRIAELKDALGVAEHRLGRLMRL